MKTKTVIKNLAFISFCGTLVLSALLIMIFMSKDAPNYQTVSNFLPVILAFIVLFSIDQFRDQINLLIVRRKIYKLSKTEGILWYIDPKNLKKENLFIIRNFPYKNKDIAVNCNKKELCLIYETENLGCHIGYKNEFFMLIENEKTKELFVIYCPYKDVEGGFTNSEDILFTSIIVATTAI